MEAKGALCSLKTGHSCCCRPLPLPNDHTDALDHAYAHVSHPRLAEAHIHVLAHTLPFVLDEAQVHVLAHALSFVLDQAHVLPKRSFA